VGSRNRARLSSRSVVPTRLLPCLTVGPYSPPDANLAPNGTRHLLLFPTDFSEASMRAFPYALSIAEKRRTDLVLLHMLSVAPHVEGYRWYTTADLREMESEAHATARQRLEELAAHADLAVEPVLVTNPSASQSMEC
jgi:nucleotide-binding universal stress UspA family protein